jgi:hypothetical protein
VKGNKKTLKDLFVLGRFWMLDISFIQIIITHITFTCEGNPKKNPFWMLDISFIQIIITHIIFTCEGNQKKNPFWMLDISFIQIIDTHIICTCGGNPKILIVNSIHTKGYNFIPFNPLLIWGLKSLKYKE